MNIIIHLYTTSTLHSTSYFTVALRIFLSSFTTYENASTEKNLDAKGEIVSKKRENSGTTSIGTNFFDGFAPVE